jgi:hypothetical protein
VPELSTTSIWGAFGRALGAEPRTSRTIRGVSGLDHLVEGISVDDKGNRVIVFAAEPNPRVAALMQVDIQATMPTARVLVARPIAFDFAAIARGLVQQVGQPEIDFVQVKRQIEEVNLKIEELKSAGIEPDFNDMCGGLFNVIGLTFKNLQLPP